MEKYINEQFEEWFDMPLEFPDENINQIIRDTARVAFTKGFITPRPTYWDYLRLLFKN